MQNNDNLHRGFNFSAADYRIIDGAVIKLTIPTQPQQFSESQKRDIIKEAIQLFPLMNL